MPTIRQRIENNQILLSATCCSASDRPTGLTPNYIALLDTGAQSTMVSPKVVEQANLTPDGYTDVLPVNGELFRAFQYEVALGIPISTGGNMVMTAGDTLTVAAMPYQPRNFDILLGMDLLRIFHFTMYNNTFILST